MRGSVNFQINRIFKESGIFRPGESKHEAKKSARAELAQEGSGATPQRMASKTDMHETIESYKTTWHNVGHHACEMGLKDMTRLEPRHIQSYLEKRIVDEVVYGTWQKEAAHCGKLAVALDKFSGQKLNFQQAANELRPLAKDVLETPDRQRGFVEPREVVEEIRNPDYRLMATIQLEGGGRMSKVTLIRADQLRGDNRLLLENTKGGKLREISVQPDTYRQLEARLNESGEIRAGDSAYRSAPARATNLAGEPVTGTHDFRYNYAHQRYHDLTREGLVSERAHQVISWEMGHERADITMHYLR